MDALEERNISCLCQDLNPTWLISLLHSHYTHYTAWALLFVPEINKLGC